MAKSTKKIIKREKVREFAVGMKIVPISNISSHSYEIGKMYKVSFVDPNGNCRAKDSHGKEGNWLRREECEQVIEIKKDVKPTSLMFDILVLPHEYKTLIKDTISQVKDEVRNKIFEMWGFGALIEKGKGMIMLFWGPPGTGKTMCAEAISQMIGKDFAILGTKDIQSSVPGQTERNIQIAFQRAKDNDLVLILDECDSLVFSRDTVGGILAAEINCLLTEIERFDGICILTTNRSDTLDEALERRVCLKLEFEKPTEEARENIWRNLLPKKAPLNPNVDLKKLAEYQLTGGQIKNAILTAARRAASQAKENITMEDFVEGITRELLGTKAWQRSNKYQTLQNDVWLKSGHNIGITKDMKTSEIEKESDENGEKGTI